MDKPQLYEGTNKLETRIKSSDRVLTIGDASAITGYAMDDAKQMLDRLMEKYHCRLKITENGDLIYDFGSLQVRGERTWAEWWYATKQQLWKIFVFVFKIWITITLVVYFAIFLIILIAAIIAMTASNKDGDNSGGAEGIFAFIGEIFRSIFIWNYVSTSRHYEYDRYGYPYQSYDTPNSTWNKLNKKKSKGFVASVYDFVFGPPRVELNPLENQQEVASYLRKNKGIITKPELIALAGWTSEKAEDFFSEVVVKYKGDSKISDNAVLYGDFFELVQSTSSGAEAPVVWYWDEYEPEYKLTGNSFWRNVGVGFMNLFNLAFATFFVSLAFDAGAGQEGLGSVIIVLGWIPFVFSVLFFGVPILRSLQLASLRRKRHLQNIRKRLMKVIYQNRDREIPLETLLNTVNSSSNQNTKDGKGEEKLSKETVEYMMQELIKDFDGEIELKDSGQVIYKFENLKEELEEAEKLRVSRDSGKSLGNIVFDSQD